MSSLARVANESTMPTSASTLAERSRREVEVLAALAQLERDLQRLSRALLLAAPPPGAGTASAGRGCAGPPVATPPCRTSG